MKLRILILGLILNISFHARAQWFPAHVNLIVLPQYIGAEVLNPYLHPIVCQGTVFGQTSFGQIYHSYFYNQFLPVGGRRMAFVTTTPFIPFIHGWANIYCY